MSNLKYEFNFNFFKFCLFLTLLLAILKLGGVIDISGWLIFLPLIISVGWFAIIVFIIGLITIYFVDKELNNTSENGDSDEINGNS